MLLCSRICRLPVHVTKPSHKDWDCSQSLFFSCYLREIVTCFAGATKNTNFSTKPHTRQDSLVCFKFFLYANFLLLLQFLFSTYLFCDSYSALSPIDGILDVTQKTVGGTIYEYTKFYPVMEPNRYTFPLSDYREILSHSDCLLRNCIKDDVFHRIVVTQSDISFPCKGRNLFVTKRIQVATLLEFPARLYPTSHVPNQARALMSIIKRKIKGDVIK